VLRRAAEGDPEARESLVEDPSYFRGDPVEIPAQLLTLGVEETHEVAVEILDRWAEEVFPGHAERVADALERDAGTRRAQLETMSPEEVVEGASGVQYSPDPSIRQVFLLPQVAMRPWVLLCEHDDVRMFVYPVADESLSGDASAPPGRLVRFHRALGDEKRLRMLKAIATSTATLQELADRFGLPKSTAHHHLAILRAAGLVRVSSDYERRYSVRREAPPEAERWLKGYLEGGSA
jgi:DNA-binding transcriptional ArsR family regulator